MLLKIMLLSITTASAVSAFQGKIVDPSGTGISGITVTQRNTGLTAITNSSGDFSIANSTSIANGKNSSWLIQGRNLQIYANDEIVSVDAVGISGKSETLLKRSKYSGKLSINLQSFDKVGYRILRIHTGSNVENVPMIFGHAGLSHLSNAQNINAVASRVQDGPDSLLLKIGDTVLFSVAISSTPSTTIPTIYAVHHKIIMPTYKVGPTPNKCTFRLISNWGDTLFPNTSYDTISSEAIADIGWKPWEQGLVWTYSSLFYNNLMFLGGVSSTSFPDSIGEFLSPITRLDTTASSTIFTAIDSYYTVVGHPSISRAALTSDSTFIAAGYNSSGKNDFIALHRNLTSLIVNHKDTNDIIIDVNNTRINLFLNNGYVGISIRRTDGAEIGVGNLAAFDSALAIKGIGLITNGKKTVLARMAASTGVAGSMVNIASDVLGIAGNVLDLYDTKAAIPVAKALMNQTIDKKTLANSIIDCKSIIGTAFLDATVNNADAAIERATGRSLGINEAYEVIKDAAGCYASVGEANIVGAGVSCASLLLKEAENIAQCASLTMKLIELQRQQNEDLSKDALCEKGLLTASACGENRSAAISHDKIASSASQKIIVYGDTTNINGLWVMSGSQYYFNNGIGRFYTIASALWNNALNQGLVSIGDAKFKIQKSSNPLNWTADELWLNYNTGTKYVNYVYWVSGESISISSGGNVLTITGTSDGNTLTDNLSRVIK